MPNARISFHDFAKIRCGGAAVRRKGNPRLVGRSRRREPRWRKPPTHIPRNRDCYRENHKTSSSKFRPRSARTRAGKANRQHPGATSCIPLTGKWPSANREFARQEQRILLGPMTPRVARREHHYRAQGGTLSFGRTRPTEIRACNLLSRFGVSPHRK